MQCSWSGDQLHVELIRGILFLLHPVAPSKLLAYVCDGLTPCVVREAPHALVRGIVYLNYVCHSIFLVRQIVYLSHICYGISLVWGIVSFWYEGLLT